MVSIVFDFYPIIKYNYAMGEQLSKPGEKGTTVEQKSSTGELKTRVSKFAGGLFGRLDAHAAQMIGFSGNILTELKGHRLYDRNIDVPSIDPALRRFVDVNKFYYRFGEGGRTGFYNINDLSQPRFFIHTSSGSFDMTMYEGNDSNDISAERRYHDPLYERFSHAIEIQTFPSTAFEDVPDSVMSIKYRTKDRQNVTLHYRKLNEEGDVSLIEAQRVTIIPSPHITGTLDLKERRIIWKKRFELGLLQNDPDVDFDTDNNKLIIRSASPNSQPHELPIVTNIFEELEGIAADIMGQDPQVFRPGVTNQTLIK